MLLVMYLYVFVMLCLFVLFIFDAIWFKVENVIFVTKLLFEPNGLLCCIKTMYYDG